MSTLSRTRSDVSTGLWGTEQSGGAPFRPADLDNDRFPSKRPSPGKRASRALSRFVITFCIGVAATLAWQSYGDAAREMIASSSPQLGWLAPQDAVAQTAPAAMAPTASSPDPQELKAMSVDLAEVRQRVDQNEPDP